MNDYDDDLFYFAPRENMIECPECQGEGGYYIEDEPDYWRECPKCEGQGEIEKPKPEVSYHGNNPDCLGHYDD